MIVYILFSPKANLFYTGFTTETIETRLDRHLNHYYSNKFTSRIADDWVIYLTINCSSIKQALSIEKHIKKMKSKVYIQNLKRYPTIIEKLIQKYED